MLEQTTWIIWGALHAHQSEFSQRLGEIHDASEQPVTQFQYQRRHGFAFVLVSIIVLIVLRLILTVDWLTILISNSFILILGIIPVLILMSGTLNGTRWAYQVANVIYHDLHEERYDLLSLSPLGVLGALWMITRRQSRMNYVVAFFQTVGFALFLATILVGLLFIYTLLQGPPTLFLSQPILGSVLTIGLVILIFYLDFVQAIIIGYLSGIYFASIASSIALAQSSAIFITASIQIATYIMAGLVAFLGAIISTYLFRQTNDATLLLISLVFVGTAYVFREVAIRVLWRTILIRFSVTHVELSEFHQQIP
jgi:hypothetical protein